MKGQGQAVQGPGKASRRSVNGGSDSGDCADHLRHNPLVVLLIGGAVPNVRLQQQHVHPIRPQGTAITLCSTGRRCPLITLEGGILGQACLVSLLTVDRWVNESRDYLRE